MTGLAKAFRLILLVGPCLNLIDSQSNVSNNLSCLIQFQIEILFLFLVRPGDNIVKRDSDESSVTISEPHSFPSLIAEVEQAINGTGDYEIDKVKSKFYSMSSM